MIFSSFKSLNGLLTQNQDYAEQIIYIWNNDYNHIPDNEIKTNLDSAISILQGSQNSDDIK